MPVRVFGALKGAGTQVRETSPTKPIQEGPLGTTVMVGVFRSGPVGEVVEHTGGLEHYRRVRGGLSQASEAPLCAEHFYEAGNGAGILWTLRITDGTERAASLDLYDRDVELGILERQPAAKLPASVITMDAANGGRWAGRARVKTGQVGTLASVISSNTIDLDFATDVDAWAGATLSFPNDDSGAEYTVTSNDAAGVLTVAGDWTAATLAGTDGTYQLELRNLHELTGKPEYLAIEVADSTEIAAGFSLYVHRDGDQVKAWEHATLDSSGARYWYDAITAETADNWELAPTDNFTGDPSDPYKRPANFAEIPAPDGVAANVLTLQIVRWTRAEADASGFDSYLDTVNDVTWGSSPRAATIVVTFTSSTEFDVAATFADGGETAADLPSGTLGTAYAAPNAFLPGFTLRAGSTAPEAGDTITIYARPLPDGLADRGCWLYVAAGPDDGDVLERYRVVDNDHESVTLAPSVDLSGTVIPPGAPALTSSTAGTYNLTGGGQTLIFTVGGSGPYTLTNTLTGSTTTALALAGELNGKETARAGSADARLVIFSVSADGKLQITARQDFGATASLVLGNGTLNAIVGFTNGQTGTGETPTRIRLQWRQEMAGGYDGIAAIEGEDYADAFNLGSSPLNVMITENTGGIRYAIPGITDADAQAAAMIYAYEQNGLFYGEIPDTVTSEAAAIAWHKGNLAIGPAQDYHAVPFPSYGQIKSPYGSGLYTAPLSGLILGLTAKRAVEAGGYQDAPAGTTWTLSPWVKAYPSGVVGPLDNEALNGYGLIEVRARGPKFYLFGDRIPGDGARGWLHKRITMSHIGRILLTNTEALAFKRINRATFADVQRLLRGLFYPWYRRGWFSDAAGPDFTDQVLIKVDDTNNPPEERALGNLHAAISFDVVDTAERVVFTIGPAGVTEG